VQKLKPLKQGGGHGAEQRWRAMHVKSEKREEKKEERKRKR